ncbi:hypothetical protein MRB53_041689 [Persea americana]|nr:hypothetical protein MRB53_041689 [Persea americana]
MPLAALRISLSTTSRYGVYIQRRNASHNSQGRANKAHQGPGKRLGSRKTGGEYVVPGNILYKQRGTLWFPGENTHRYVEKLTCSNRTDEEQGRDHTIHASQPGYVRYYRDPMKDKRRKYIGVVLDKDDQLPHSPYEAPRRRNLGMLAYEMKEAPRTNVT